ncbi:bifunctional phosphopantothenoylcysteine decarboxylase/phosphopantothenate--cysteine ligase CoaBC [Effusibacillus dendaii]|uniref:Coenzyme A biosynthesis bifunctional protein CoaBC n=1 Tax=Effusibacillus dendaii TaxID=2743772 RepID=A0A7I8DB29_9BACL|nr:bifunctional phosphopantothenoylcysteine decarboxylase/phosphopantothenate--cysteine ligase CoaBC [Effusibacillus dendaii]BCJ85121.1 peptidase ClpP [Effusibacillus dendaii]
MKGKTILVGVSGGIAAFKAASLCSALVKEGADVHVILTESATKFITPLTFQSLVKTPVITDIFTEPNPAEISHIALADKADLVVVAPATANIIGKAAHGLADDMLSTTLLATRAPVLFAPAMNVNMYNNPIVQENLTKLRERGYLLAEPGEGLLACGYTGKGRLPEPEELVEIIRAFWQQQDMKGIRILVTAGGTRERIDPVRYLTNDSSGKMGYQLAAEAVRRGAEVTLVSAAVGLTPPPKVRLIRVESAIDMYEAVLAELPGIEVVIKAAAVADYRPVVQADEKIKKTEDKMHIELVRNPDILAEIGRRKTERQVIVGFAAETNHTEANALEKLHKKNADLIVANDVTQEGAGFSVDTNIVSLVRRDRPVRQLPIMSKQSVANAVLDEILSIRRERL